MTDAGAHVMKYVSELLVCLAESQMVCTCIYVRGRKQNVPEVLCWRCASILAKDSIKLYSVLEISGNNKGRKSSEEICQCDFHEFAL